MSNLFLLGMSALERAQEKAEEARLRSISENAVGLKAEYALLRDQMERLCLLNQALWELVSAKTGLTEADLERKAQEVDLRDGVQDGKVTAHPLRCPRCARVSSSRHRQCLYCGMLFEGNVFG